MEIYDSPFRHAVIDDYIDADTVTQINAEWPKDGWYKEDGKAQIKWNTQDLTPTAKAVVDAVDVSLVEEITGIKGLITDPELSGGGLHCIPRGGFLKMHCDFNTHANGWHRRVNMLIYLNQDWRPRWGGELRLGRYKKEQVRIVPEAGRCVIFETNDKSWHGHPKPLMCPKRRQRRSLALYFYTAEPPREKPHTTVYIK